MRVIGLTGGVGCGKSQVAGLVNRMYPDNTELLLTDEIGHLAMEKGCAAYNCIIAEFGREIVREDEEIDRGVLAGMVFGDVKKLDLLDSIIHPFVKEYTANFIQEQKGREGTIILESAILFETGCDAFCDETWYVYAPEETRRERLKKWRGYADEKIDRIMAEQLSEEEFRRRCDKVIDNSGELDFRLHKQIQLALE